MVARCRLGWAVAGIVIAALAAGALAGETKKAAANADTGIPALDQADLTPGKTIKIDDPQAGEGNWTLFIPSDYDANRKWPVIFNFHSKGAQPGTRPFDALTDSKGYIVVGLGYSDAGMNNSPDVKKTMAMLTHVHNAVAKKLSIDNRLLFIGGVSQGGFRGSVYFESSPEAWAGAILLDAGREPGFSIMPNANPNYGGKPIYIGDGENDEYLPRAKDAEDFYTKHGAVVTLEVYKNMGHAVDMHSKTLRQWLLDHGPMVYVKFAFADAAALDKAGKKGKAYTAYQQVQSLADAGDLGDKAKARCDAIEAEADKRSDEAEADLSAGRRSQGLHELLEISQDYFGSPFGDKAKSRIADLRDGRATTAPAGQAGADQTGSTQTGAGQTGAGQASADQADIDKAADAAEARAVADEKSGDYAAAIARYQAYLTAFPKSHRIQQVTEHLKALQSDPAIQAKLTADKADTDCKHWMNLADNYLAAGDPDQARVYLQKIIDNYPKTTWSDSAQQKLQSLQ